MVVVWKWLWCNSGGGGVVTMVVVWWCGVMVLWFGDVEVVWFCGGYVGAGSVTVW